MIRILGIKKSIQKDQVEQKATPPKKELHITIDDYDHSGNDNISISARYLGEEKVPYTSLFVESTDISCGTQCLSGIAGLQDFVNSIPGVATDGIQETVLREIITSVVNDIKESLEAAYVLMSNNDSSYCTLLNSVLDKMALTRTGWNKSPKTDNNIQIWVL